MDKRLEKRLVAFEKIAPEIRSKDLWEYVERVEEIVDTVVYDRSDRLAAGEVLLPHEEPF